MKVRIIGNAQVVVEWEVETEEAAEELWDHFVREPFGNYEITIDQKPNLVEQNVD